MTRTWTASQSHAIDARGQALLVSAGAGSGKTSVLVERVIRLIQSEGGDIDRLLIVTFTEAAAAEMKERIGAALRKAMQEQRNSEPVARQLHLLERASISTLHSFCTQVIRRAGVQSPIGPGFRVGDESETGMLRELTLDQLLEEQFAEKQSSFLDFVECYGGMTGDREVRSWILRLYQFARSQPQPVAWLEGHVERLRVSATGNLQAAHFATAFFAALQETLQFAHQWLLRALAVARRPGGPHAYEKVLIADLQRMEYTLQATEDHDFEGLRQAITSPFARIPADKESDPSLREQAQNARNRAKKLVSGLRSGICARSELELMRDLAATTPHITALKDLTLAFHTRYEQAKQERGLVDFADLEHFAYEALTKTDGTRSAAAQEWSQRFDQVMVDEYQDTSPIQDAIIRCVLQADDINLFQVGDVKQSIYRFRMAEPQLFLDKYDAYGQGKGGKRIDLQENFRSRSAIVGAVNALFGQLFTPAFGGLAYDEHARMQEGAVYPEVVGDTPTLTGPVEVLLIERDPTCESDESVESDPAHVDVALTTADNDEQESAESDGAADTGSALLRADSEELSACEQEARVIAHKLLNLHSEKTLVWRSDQGQYTPFCWHDAAVLLRANAGRVETMMRVFRQFGIPVSGDADSGRYAGYEMRVVLSLIDVIDNPRQDIALASVLRSSIGGFSSVDLAHIRVASAGDLYTALRLSATSQAVPPAVRERVQLFNVQLDEWRTYARRHSAGDTLAYVLRVSGLQDYVHGLAGGAARLASVQAFIGQARLYDQVEQGGLSGFARYVQTHQSLGADAGGASAGGEADAVRIMTIHKSKGLEFPVVFVAALNKRFQQARGEGAIVLHRTLGFGPEAVDLSRRERYPTVASLALAAQGRREEMAEEARVLYVALTRARERLILVGCDRQLEQRQMDWRELAFGEIGGAASESNHVMSGTSLPQTVLMGARSYLDWLMPALSRLPAIQAAELFRVTVVTKLPVSTGEERLDSKMDFAQVARLETDALQWSVATGFRSAPRDLSNVPQLWTPELEDRRPIPVKWSVTELKRALTERDQQRSTGDQDDLALSTEAPWLKRNLTLVDVQPQFLHSKATVRLTGAARGTAFHRLMQRIELSSELVDPTAVCAQAERLTASGVLSKEDWDRDLLHAVAAFFRSTLGQQLLDHSADVRREVPFTMAVPVTDLPMEDSAWQGEGETGVADRRVIVQGTIDCLLIRADGILVIDYKTDRLRSDDDLTNAIVRYRPQLELYAKAAERALGLPVNAHYLYFVERAQAVAL